MKYAQTTAIQSGYERSSSIRVSGGSETPIRGLLEFQEGGSGQRILENDAILARYGFDRDTAMLWGFDIEFAVKSKP